MITKNWIKDILLKVDFKEIEDDLIESPDGDIVDIGDLHGLVRDMTIYQALFALGQLSGNLSSELIAIDDFLTVA